MFSYPFKKNGGSAKPVYAVPRIERYKPFETEFLIPDVSGSMEEPFGSGKSKLQVMHEAILAFLSAKLERFPQSRIALVFYSDQAFLACPPLCIGSDYNRIVQALGQIMNVPHGGTCMAEALQKVTELLWQEKGQFGAGIVDVAHHSSARVIAWSDGHDQAANAGISLADALKQQGLLLETMGIAKSPAEVNEDFLKRVATTDADNIVHYRWICSEEQAHETFKSLGGHGTLGF